MLASRPTPAFGSDEYFFGSDDEVKTITDLYNGTLDDQDAAEDVDASSLAYQRWHQAQEADPVLTARIAALPDMIDATRARRFTDPDDSVICYVRTESDGRLWRGHADWPDASPHGPRGPSAV